MAYFNYHSKAKKLISQGYLIHYEFVDNWNGIKPALVLYFDNANPIPIREYRWQEYLPLIGLVTEDLDNSN
ncbi:thermostable hemolysin delta-VPH [Gilliamella apis]|uniref:thermostable hemolysin delta-VPH n=1 Tax=Gilliamella apis TaxID=1970738 RepID=UPI00080DB8EB|nr:thermostable hemolysin delta-VPH [Gilliamella apis]OCG04239.1 thermostable hemolysin delta-VPH [Gilliamella apis]